VASRTTVTEEIAKLHIYKQKQQNDVTKSWTTVWKSDWWR